MTSSATSTGHAKDILQQAEDDLEFPFQDREQSSLLGLEQNLSHQFENEEEEDHANEVSSWKRVPWWKRPSPYWLIFGTLISSTGSSAVLAPKVAMYTALVCRVQRPEYGTNNHSLLSLSSPWTHNFASTLTVDTPIPSVSGGNGTTVNITFAQLPNPTNTSASDDTQHGIDSTKKCASDPVVQAVVARLSAVFNTSTGILSCLTAGWWGSLSDRRGRRIVYFVATFGLFVSELTHIITAWFVDVLPGGYWFPLVGFFIEGLCGGRPNGVAIVHTYLADTTNPTTRSRYLSLLLGLIYTGVAVGPVLGGLLIRSTGTILSVFSFSCIIHGAYTIFVLFILPEPLTRARIRGACLRRRQEKAKQVSSGRALDVLKSIAGFLRPLLVLLPERSLDANPHKLRRDWTLFFAAIAYGLGTSATGSLSYKFQYVAAQFDWSPEITSYYVSLTGATRAFFLVAILPLIINYFKASPIQPPSTSDESLRGLSPSRGTSSPPGVDQINASERRVPASRPPAFDLALARVSVGLETTSFLGMAIATTGIFFALASTIGSFAAGFSPAMQALALDIYTNRHPENRGRIGALYGALSVIQALMSHIISPALYGFVYSNTVARFPQAIFVMSTSKTLLALTLLLFVGISSKRLGDHVPAGHGNERRSQDTTNPETLLAVENQVERR